MIDFDLSDEHHLLEQTVRDWGAREVAPRIRELDRAHKFDRSVLPKMAELGLLGCSVPQEYVLDAQAQYMKPVDGWRDVGT